jgi:hypothetical protein
MKRQKRYFLIVLLVAMALFAGGFVVLRISGRNVNQILVNQQVSQTPTLIPPPHIISVACTKTSSEAIKWDSYFCSLYSLKLPTGWRVSGSDHLEFTNYDYTSAEGRPYNPALDKEKLKFAITVTRTTQDLPTFVRKDTQVKQYKVLTSTPVALNGYSAIKTSYVGTADGYRTPFYTIYLQNRSKNLLAAVDFIFGFNNYPNLDNQIISNFRFTN